MKFELRVSRRTLALACPSLLLVITAAVACAAHGDLDPAFANAGAAFADWSAHATRDAHVAVDAAGNVFVTATASSPGGNRLFAAAKFRPDGNAHTGFGFLGLRTLDFDLVADGFDLLHGVYALAGGQLMLLGTAEIAGNVSAPAMARLTAAGNADAAFGSGGKRVITSSPWAPEGMELVATAQQRDGKFVFGGWCTHCPGPRNAVVLRVDANGDPDLGFGADG